MKGNFSSHEHSQHSKSEYDPGTNTLTVKGAQIIGWICTVIPKFPAETPPKAEKPKPEEPKAEEPKAEEPKAEEPKAG